MQSKDILIWGAGAIGGTVGAYLARAGHDVTFVDLVPKHVQAIQDPQKGLHISGPNDDFIIHAPAFLPEMLKGSWQRIFLAVKAQDTVTACRALKPFLAPNGYVLSLQNGLCESEIARTVGLERTVGAFVNFGADWQGPGEIVFANYAAFVIGELSGTKTPRLAKLHADLKAFDPNVVESDRVESYLWGKLAYGTFLIGQALCNQGIAECLDRQELLPLWQKVAGEVVAAARAEGVQMEGFNGFDPSAFDEGATTDQAASSVSAMRKFNAGNAKTHSGVWRDLAIRRRKTEVEPLLGDVVKAGEKHGMPCTAIRALMSMIAEIEQGSRKQSDDNLNELMNELVGQ